MRYGTPELADPWTLSAGDQVGAQDGGARLSVLVGEPHDGVDVLWLELLNTPKDPQGEDFDHLPEPRSGDPDRPAATGVLLRLALRGPVYAVLPQVWARRAGV